jgi:histidinol phosphatase-like enzyme
MYNIHQVKNCFIAAHFEKAVSKCACFKPGQHMLGGIYEAPD